MESLPIIICYYTFYKKDFTRLMNEFKLRAINGKSSYNMFIYFLYKDFTSLMNERKLRAINGKFSYDMFIWFTYKDFTNLMNLPFFVPQHRMDCRINRQLINHTFMKEIFLIRKSIWYLIFEARKVSLKKVWFYNIHVSWSKAAL